MLDIKTIKKYCFLSGIGFLIVVLAIFIIWIPEKGMADDELNEPSFNLRITQETTLLPEFSHLGIPPEVLRRVKVVVTAYSSSVWETQGDPFITASGSRVRDGIVANNLLPFGTLVRMPELFGDKIFVVEDRMHSKKGYYHVDVWFPSREQALEFGSKLTEMEILTN